MACGVWPRRRLSATVARRLVQVRLSRVASAPYAMEPFIGSPDSCKNHRHNSPTASGPRRQTTTRRCVPPLASRWRTPALTPDVRATGAPPAPVTCWCWSATTARSGCGTSAGSWSSGCVLTIRSAFGMRARPVIRRTSGCCATCWTSCSRRRSPRPRRSRSVATLSRGKTSSGTSLVSTWRARSTAARTTGPSGAGTPPERVLSAQQRRHLPVRLAHRNRRRRDHRPPLGAMGLARAAVVQRAADARTVQPADGPMARGQGVRSAAADHGRPAPHNRAGRRSARTQIARPHPLSGRNVPRHGSTRLIPRISHPAADGWERLTVPRRAAPAHLHYPLRRLPGGLSRRAAAWPFHRLSTSSQELPRP